MRDTLRRHLLLLPPLALAVWVLWWVGGTWLTRLPYPFDLEWMEGGILTHAWRIQHLKPLYVEPSAEFVPMIYPPGYYAALAALGLPFGLSAPIGRGISIVATLVACAALPWATRHHLGRAIPGLIAAGVYLGTYELTGAFQDLVRPDSLGLALLAWSLVLAPSGIRHAPVWAGLLLFLSFTVKHNAAAYAIAVVPALWVWHGRKPALRYLVAFAAPALLFVGVLQLLSGGHFLTYLLGVPGSHPMNWLRVMPGTPTEIAKSLPVVAVAISVLALANATRIAPRIPVPAHVLPAILGAVVMVLVFSSRKEAEGGLGVTGLVLVGAGGVATLTALSGQLLRRKVDGPWLFATAVITVALVTSGLMRGHHGGFVNVFMPACWVLCGAFAVAIAQAIDALPKDNGTALLSIGATLQLALPSTTIDFDRFVPTERDYLAGEHILDTLRTIDGPVLSPFAAFLPALVGKEPSTHLISLWDVGHRRGPFPHATRPMSEALADHRWAAIVDSKKPMGYGVRKHYRIATTFPLEGDALTPRTGWRARPTVLLTPTGALPTPVSP